MPRSDPGDRAPAPSRRATKKASGNGGNLGFEDKLWQAADLLRGSMDPSEYKHVVLGLVFLKYISDAFEQRRMWLAQEVSTPDSEYYIAESTERYMVVDDRSSYMEKNVFWVPDEARWMTLQAYAHQPDIGQRVDGAMRAIEQSNPSLKDVLPRDYGRPSLDKNRLGRLVDLVATIGLGDDESRSKDILGRVYEYFLGKFAGAEGKGGGEHYTPRSIVKLLVEMIEPYSGRVYDPCCGSSGMFVQSAKFIEAHGGGLDRLSIFGQESNNTTWKLAKMNLAIRGIEANLGPHNADSFVQDIHPDLKADFIFANPPFNMSDWGGDRLRDDVRWKYGAPPVNNANYAWVEHIIHHLAPSGIAGFVLANGSMSSSQSGEGDIRKSIVEADLVDCMIALPQQLFYGTGIPACLWFATRTKRTGRFRDRRRDTLFVDARKLGHLIDRTHRELTDDEIDRVARTYHAWCGEAEAGAYEDVAGFCKSATTDEIASQGYVLTPGRYVGAEVVDDDAEPFEEKMARLVGTLEEQFAESARLETEIRKQLRGLGFGGR